MIPDCHLLVNAFDILVRGSIEANPVIRLGTLPETEKLTVGWYVRAWMSIMRTGPVAI